MCATHVTGGVSLPVVLAGVTDPLSHGKVDVVAVDTTVGVVFDKSILAGFKVENYVKSGFLLSAGCSNRLDKTGVFLLSGEPVFTDGAPFLPTLVTLVGSDPLATVLAHLVGMYADYYRHADYKSSTYAYYHHTVNPPITPSP